MNALRKKLDHNNEEVQKLADEVSAHSVVPAADELPEAVRRMLDNPSKPTTVEEEIECRTTCVELGRRNAVNTAGCENLVVFVGITGAGKSTLVSQGA